MTTTDFAKSTELDTPNAPRGHLANTIAELMADVRRYGELATRAADLEAQPQDDRLAAEAFSMLSARLWLVLAPAVGATVPAMDFHAKGLEVIIAKELVKRIWDAIPAARTMIEDATGTWFVFGQDRDAAPQASPAQGEPNAAILEALAPFKRDEWTVHHVKNYPHKAAAIINAALGVGVQQQGAKP